MSVNSNNPQARGFLALDHDTRVQVARIERNQRVVDAVSDALGLSVVQGHEDGYNPNVETAVVYPVESTQDTIVLAANDPRQKARFRVTIERIA